MKVKNLVNKVGISLVVISLFGYGCQKAESTLTSVLPTVSTTEQAQLLNADNQDAVADKTDQDVDKALDVLQNNGYNIKNTALKSAGSYSIDVDHPDSTTFPKIITITFTNYIDTAASEFYTKNGSITVVVTADSVHPKLITRVITFHNFTFSTDSSSFTITGARTVTRKSVVPTFDQSKNMRVSVVDNIDAALSYKFVNSTKDSISITRAAKKVRTAYLHYKNVGGLPWKSVIYKNDVNSDTVNYTGVVTGKNEKGYLYTKTVLSQSPLNVTFYQSAPVITSGTMEYTVTNDSNKTAKYTLTFSQSDANPHKTTVSVVNDNTFKTYTYVSRLKRKFIKY